jgi:hypothetical protein
LRSGDRASGRATALAAVVATLLACPATSPAHTDHARARHVAPQLRGAMITPNWSIAGSAFARSADQQRAEIQDVCSMGGDLIRVHVDWSQLQPGTSGPTGRLPGDYDPGYVARLDQIIGWAAACRIRVIFDVVGTPCWAIAPAPCDGTTWIFDAPPGGLFRTVAGYLLARYPRLYALEVWNEPNYGFWKGTLPDYAALVEEAVDARNALGSQTKILAGALVGEDPAYLDQLYAVGMHGQDGISLHPYSMDCEPTCGPFVNPARRQSPFRRAIAAAHAVMLRHHDPGGIYLTEFGFGTCPAQPACVSERTAGQWLAASLQVAARYRYVKALTVFSLRDFADPADQNPRWDMRSGILRQNLAPKPAFAIVRREITRLRRR